MKQVITVDFDFTLASSDSEGNLLPVESVINFVKGKHLDGYELHIVTFRNLKDKKEVKDFCEDYDIPIKSIVCTDSHNKVPFLKDLKSVLHIDDNAEVCLLASLAGIEVLLVDWGQNIHNKNTKLFNKIRAI